MTQGLQIGRARSALLTLGSRKCTVKRLLVLLISRPGRMFLNSRLARVITHVLARVTTHVLARALLHVLAHSSRQLELARVATHVLARVATHVLARVVTHVLARVTMHMLGHVSIPITYLHGYQGHWCGQTRCRP